MTQPVWFLPFEHGDFSPFFKLALYKCNIIIIIIIITWESRSNRWYALQPPSGTHTQQGLSSHPAPTQMTQTADI